MKWRLLKGPWTDPHRNLVLEEAILSLTDAGKSPWTLRLWMNDRSVVVGVNQNLSDVKIGYCLENGIPVLRRVTGGGTVYQDLRNLNWSVFAPRDMVGCNVSSIYRTLSKPVVEAVRSLGAEAVYTPPNSIRVEGYKVSGMAAYVKRNVVLCHGTLLLDSDLNTMSEAIVVRDAVANLSTFVDVCLDEVQKAIVEAFEETFGIYLEEMGLTRAEVELHQRGGRSFRSSRLL